MVFSTWRTFPANPENKLTRYCKTYNISQTNKLAHDTYFDATAQNISTDFDSILIRGCRLNSAEDLACIS